MFLRLYVQNEQPLNSCSHHGPIVVQELLSQFCLLNYRIIQDMMKRHCRIILQWGKRAGTMECIFPWCVCVFDCCDMRKDSISNLCRLVCGHSRLQKLLPLSGSWWICCLEVHSPLHNWTALCCQCCTKSHRNIQAVKNNPNQTSVLLITWQFKKKPSILTFKVETVPEVTAMSSSILWLPWIWARIRCLSHTPFIYYTETDRWTARTERLDSENNSKNSNMVMVNHLWCHNWIVFQLFLFMAPRLLALQATTMFTHKEEIVTTTIRQKHPGQFLRLVKSHSKTDNHTRSHSDLRDNLESI